jgi:hypothetical protein
MKTNYPFRTSGFELKICEPVLKKLKKTRQKSALSVLQLATATFAPQKVTRPPTRGSKVTF